MRFPETAGRNRIRVPEFEVDSGLGFQPRNHAKRREILKYRNPDGFWLFQIWRPFARFRGEASR